MKVSLTYEEFLDVVSAGVCHYCGGALSFTGHNLDRLNNNKGYTLKNIVPCCPRCNSLKSNILTSDETLKVVDLLKKLRYGNKNLWAKPLKRRKKNGI